MKTRLKLLKIKTRRSKGWIPTCSTCSKKPLQVANHLHCRNNNRPDIPTKGLELDRKANRKKDVVVALPEMGKYLP